jgi:hypothetical protein
MKLILTTLISVTTLVSAATAQIARTLEQCEAHYGEPSHQERDSTGIVTKTFFEHLDSNRLGRDYIIIAEFADGLCLSIMYSIKNNGPIITRSEAEILLRENANGYIWTRTRTSPKGEIDYSAHLEGRVFLEAFFAPWKFLWIETEEKVRNE